MPWGDCACSPLERAGVVDQHVHCVVTLPDHVGRAPDSVEIAGIGDDEPDPAGGMFGAEQVAHRGRLASVAGDHLDGRAVSHEHSRRGETESDVAPVTTTTRPSRSY